MAITKTKKSKDALDMSNNSDKAAKTSKQSNSINSDTVELEGITSNAALKSFLQGLLDRVAEGQVPAIFAFSMMNNLISSQQICSYFCSDTKELARDIWLRVKQSGLQVRNPVFLFGASAEMAA